MSLLNAIILGIVQGIAEFLPISSSGHLILTQKIMDFFNSSKDLSNTAQIVTENQMLFDVMLHGGTLVAIIIVYRKIIWELIKKPFQKTVFLLIVATIPAILVAIFFNDQVDIIFNSGIFLAPCFIFTGIVLLLSDKFNGRKKSEDMTILDALLIGIMQGIAVLPGISRSGSTIFAALSRDVNRSEAAQFSFLMAIPAIGGALLLSLVKLLKGGDTMVIIHSIGIGSIVCGFIASLIAGYLSINFLIALIKKAKLKIFAVYVLIVGFLILLDQFIFHIIF